MKRKLLPYGMPLGGGMSGMGGMRSVNPSSGGGKSSGAGQGGYGAAPAFGGQQPTAQNQPSFEQSPYGAGPSSVNSTTTADMMGGNRGGGQGFGQTMQGMMGGGKSSGLGQGGYGMAPGFGGQGVSAMDFQRARQEPQGNFGDFGVIDRAQLGQPRQPQPGMMAPQSGQFRTKEQEAALNQRDYQNYSVLGQQPSQVGSQQGRSALGGMGGQINLDDFMTGGGRFNPYEPTTPSQLSVGQGMGALRQQQPLAQARDSYLQSNPIAQQLNQMSSSLNGRQPTQDQLSQMQSLNQQLQQDPRLMQIQQQQMQQQQRQQFNPYQQQQRFQQPQFNPYQQQFSPFQQQPQVNQFQQQRSSPFQQQFGGFQQPRQQFGGFQQQPQQQSQDMRGLSELLNLLRGRQG
jgi:hypothetical protein